MFKEMNLPVSEKDILYLIKKYDEDNCGVIHYHDFIKIFESDQVREVIQEIRKGIKCSKVSYEAAFKKFDMDNSKFIDEKEFKFIKLKNNFIL